MNMFLKLASKGVLIVLLLSSIMLSSYATNFYFDESTNNHVIYTSNTIPSIELNLQSQSSEELSIDRILFDTESETYPFLPQIIQPYEEVDVSFILPSDLDLTREDIDVNLEISIPNNLIDDNLDLVGDPTEFQIRYIPDNTQIVQYSSFRDPQKKLLSSPILRGDDSDFKLYLNNNISFYEVQIDGVFFDSNSYDVSRLQDLIDVIELDISSFESGSYQIVIFHRDVAGNENSITFTLTIADLPLQVTKVYSRADSQTYSYYFNRSFGGTEFNVNSFQRMFNFEFETNFNATCYVERVSEYRDYFNSEPETIQQLKHVVSIDIPTPSTTLEGIWIMCENTDSPFMEEERVYLSEVMFGNKGLIDFQFIEQRTDFEITYFYPTGIVTFSPPRVELHTNYKSFCEFSINNRGNYILMSNLDEDGLKHYNNNSLNSILGNVTLYSRCVDELYNVDEMELNFEINPREDTQLIDWNPKYSAVDMVDFEFEISDANAQCGLINRLSLIGGNRVGVDGLINATRVEEQKIYFDQVGPFSREGRNDNLTLRCVNEQGRVSDMNFYLIYDPTPPEISDVVLRNHLDIETNKFSVKDYMQVNFDVDSDIIDHYTITFTNSEINLDFDERPFEVEENFSQDTSFTLTATDELNRTSRPVQVTYDFDTIPPTLSVNIGNSASKRTISCSDGFDDCYRVYYGTSLIESACTTRSIYMDGSQIDVFGSNFLCVRGVDFAGNEVTLIQNISISGDVFNPGNGITTGGGTTGGNNTVTPESDTDGDGIIDRHDPDVEGDGIPDQWADLIGDGQGDIDGDGILDINDSDIDGDGILNGDDLNPTQANSDDRIIDRHDPNDNFNLTGFQNPNDEGEFNWVLASAFAFILLLVGTGGYYAYSRGYLDDQLIAMGVKKKKEQQVQTGTQPYSSIPKNSLNKKPIKKTGGGAYNSHLDKLNDFIDSTLDKNSKIFNEFDGNSTKGNVSSFKDTLIANKKDVKEESKDFENFHKEKKNSEK